MGEPVVITLRKPITFGDRRIEKLTIRPIKAKDLRRLKSSDDDIKSTLDMASWLSGEVSQVIDELEGPDLAAVLETVNNFFHVIRGTGPASSEP